MKIKRFSCLGITTLLSIIILALIIQLTNLKKHQEKPSVSAILSKYLAQHHVYLHQKKTIAKQPSIIEIRNFTLKKVNLILKGSLLKINIKEKSLTITNPYIEINNKPYENDIFPILPIKIQKIKLDNLTFISKNIIVKKANITLSKDNATFQGNIEIRSGNLNIIAHISNGWGIIKTEGNSLFIPQFYAAPKDIFFSKGEAHLLIKQPILLSNIFIKIKPFLIKAGNINTAPTENR